MEFTVLLGTVQGLILGAVLLTLDRGNRPANRTLGLLMILFSVTISTVVVLEEAVRYNSFLVDLIVESRGDSTSAVDYGAGTGTTSAEVRVSSPRGDISKSSIRIYDCFVFPLSCVLDQAGASRLLGKNFAMLLKRPSP